MQGKNGDSFMKNGPVDTVEDGEGRTSWESGIDVYTLPRLVGSAVSYRMGTGDATQGSVTT